LLDEGRLGWFVDEIERVIFESHSQDDRDGAIDFGRAARPTDWRFQQAREPRPKATTTFPNAIGTELRRKIS